MDSGPDAAPAPLCEFVVPGVPVSAQSRNRQRLRGEDGPPSDAIPTVLTGRRQSALLLGWPGPISRS